MAKINNNPSESGYGLTPLLSKEEKKAKWIIWSFSGFVFLVVVVLSRYKLNLNLGFDPHIFATLNAAINSGVTILLLTALFAVKKQWYVLHKRLMLIAIALSILFLLSYICHHLFAGETRYGDVNHDGLVSVPEKSEAGSARMVYYVILITHIPLAGVVLPFILFTAYRALTGEYQKHKKLARITWPLWFYVAITGVIVYFMISPYY